MLVEEPDPAVEAECRAILKQLVAAVATQIVTAEQETLLAELEDYQVQCWTRDEFRHRQRMRARVQAAQQAQQQTTARAPSCRLRSTSGEPRRSSSHRQADSTARAAAPSESAEAPQGALRPRRRAKLRTLSAQVDADFSALATQMQALGVTGVQNGAAAPARGGGGGGAGSGGSGATRSVSGSGLSTAATSSRRHSSCEDTRRRRGDAIGADRAAAGASEPSELELAERSYVELLLPSAPARSQFVFEMEQPIVSHAQSQDSVHDRLLQRRLALLAGQQHETVRLERKQRMENSGKVRSNLVYSLPLSDGPGPAAMHRGGAPASAPAPPWNASTAANFLGPPSRPRTQFLTA